MKRFKPLSLVALLGIIMMILATGSAFAAGTNAGETVFNQATLSYDVGTVTTTVSSDNDTDPSNGINGTTLLVDNKVDLTMSATGATVIPGSTNQILVFTLENTGNEDQGYDIDLFVGATPADDDFDMNSVRVYLDNNKDGLLDGGDTLYTVNNATLSSIGDVPANSGASSIIQILVVANTPATATDTQTASYTLKANTLHASTHPSAGTETTDTGGVDDPAAIDIVLADSDAGAGVGGSTDGATNGDFLDTATYTVQAATIAVTKTAAVISDPINGVSANAKAIPGAIVRYTITVSNSGATDATNVVLTDTIPTFTDFYIGSVSTTGTVAYDDGSGSFTYGPLVDEGFGQDSNVSDLRVTIATIQGTTNAPPSGGSETITFDVRIE